MNRLVICTVMNFNALCILKHDNLILLSKFRSLVPCANRSVDKSKWDVSYLFSFVVLEHPLLAVLAQVQGGDLVDDLVGLVRPERRKPSASRSRRETLYNFSRKEENSFNDLFTAAKEKYK